MNVNVYGELELPWTANHCVWIYSLRWTPAALYARIVAAVIRKKTKGVTVAKAAGFIEGLITATCRASKDLAARRERWWGWLWAKSTGIASIHAAVYIDSMSHTRNS